MGVGSGVAAQLMVAEETVYGTYVPVARSYEMVSENIKTKIERIESKGLRAGRRVLTSGKWQAGKRSAAGDINLEVATTGFGLWLKHMMGGLATAGGAGVFTHTATPGDLPVALSVQVGKPSIDGTVQPFSYMGARIHAWELSIKAGELLHLKASIGAQDESTANSLGSFVDPANNLLSFVGATLTSGGVQVDVLDWNMKGNNALDLARFRIRNAATPKQPLENNFRDYTGQIVADFESLTQYNHYINADEVALVVSFVGGIISGGSHFSLIVTANIRFDGDTPVVAGPAMLTQPITYEAIASGALDGSAVSMVYQTSDAAP